ncbi:MAG: hypothetical protein HY017_26310 [Betaproteobacteria bacterium]|nr:hypothetical protein [Betaproteobacteria bacterium]
MTVGNRSNAFATLLQVLAILCAVLFLSMILHKGIADVSALALKHSGAKFWEALAQYVLRNLAGG